MADQVAASLYRAPAENESIPLALLEAMSRHGGAKEIVEDQDRTALSYDRLLLGAMVLGRKLADGTDERENVGVLLPNVNGCAVTFFGLLFRNRVPVMLNFTAGLRNLQSACETAKVPPSSPPASSSRTPSWMISSRRSARAGASSGSTMCGRTSARWTRSAA